MRRVLRLLSAVGPGLFAIGYPIGTGSVTSMAKAGSDYGLGLLWVLALSCLFSGVLMEAYGRMAAVTGETSLHAIKRFLPGGKGLAAARFTCIVLGQYTCLGGILVLSSGALAEVFRANVPLVAIAIPVMGVMYALLMIGHISVFEKILSFFVALMALTFVFAAFVTCPDAATLARAAKPILPSGGASLLMFAAFVGTTMAAPTFVTRPLLVKAKGWSAADLAVQRRDSAVSAILMFVISGAIMFVSTGVLFKDGRSIVRILDIAGALEPVAGRFAVAFFMVGVLAAGLSSIFPILMVAPILIGDWRHGELETRTGLFRVICFAAAVYGVLFTLIRVNPVMLTVAAQVSNVFALPLAVGLILWLVNRRDVMGAHRAGAAMNLALAAAMVFSVAVAAAGITALMSVE